MSTRLPSGVNFKRLERLVCTQRSEQKADRLEKRMDRLEAVLDRFIRSMERSGGNGRGKTDIP